MPISCDIFMSRRCSDKNLKLGLKIVSEMTVWHYNHGNNILAILRIIADFRHHKRTSSMLN